MKLSVVITTRNRKKDLLNCIRSLKKSYLHNINWELIVVDDNSTDGTEKLTMEDLSLKTGKIIHNRSQIMMVKARNLGIMNAAGDYILFVDDDNIVDPNMIHELIDFADKNITYGIIGPSMYYLKQNKKYMNYQIINFFTGRTLGVRDNSKKKVCESDGVPNVFLIRKKVFAECGLFDEALIQTFTEPDYAFHVRKFGYNCGILKKAKTRHNVNDNSMSVRTLGGHFSQKSYCLMRNRTVIIFRYGQWFHKIIYLLFFSWFWPLVYSLIILNRRNYKLVQLYWLGYFDGLRYIITGKLKNSLKTDD